MSRKSFRRASLLDEVRNTNYLRKSFGVQQDDLISEDIYFEILKREYANWKKLHNEKIKRTNERPKQLTLKEEDRVDKFIGADLEFWNSRVDYSEMLQTAKDFLQATLFLKKLRAEYDEQCDLLVDKIHTDRDAILRELLRKRQSQCNICNNGYCNEEIHGLRNHEFEFCPSLESHFLTTSID